MKEVKEKFKGKVEVKKVNIELSENYKLAERYKVRLMPTIIILDKDKKVVKRHEGILKFEDIEKIFNSMEVK